MFEISMKHIYVTQLLFFFSFFFVFWFLILELSTINEFEKKNHANQFCVGKQARTIYDNWKKLET